MLRDAETYKDYIRDLVGETYWKSPPAIVAFSREYLSREGALVFSLEHCQLTDRFPRWLGNIIANCPYIDVRANMIENLYVEEVKDPTIELGHNESMWQFAIALGATQDQILQYEPLITTTMALQYFDNVSRTKTWLEAFAAIGVLELLTNAAIAARYGQMPLNSPKTWAGLGLTKRDMSHWSAAESADHGAGDTGVGHGEEALALLAKYARTEEEQEAAAKALREAILVHMYQYNQIGLKAIEATKRTRQVAV
jgi:pyrroloquinoline quinone (PQQ) biosynthesis protein C